MTMSDWVRKSMEEGSWIRRMFEEGIALKQQYGEENVYDLSLGNPIMEPPPEFHRELRRLAENPIPGMHRYMENAGYAETREAVANQLSLENGVKMTRDSIIMTISAAGGLNVILKTLLNPRDEVIIFAPYFPEFINYIENHLGVAKILPCDDFFIPRLDVLQSAINERTRAVLVNSPNNPSGAVYDADFFSRLGKLLEKKSREIGRDIILINDEAYRKLVFDGQTSPPVWPYYKQSIMVASYSKDLAIPGERIGYLAIHPDMTDRELLVAGFIHCNRILGYVNAPALMQRLIRPLQGIHVSIDEYQLKRDFLYEQLVKMGYSLHKPQGAFYMFPKSPIADEVAFIQELREHRVLTVPGRSFGTPGYFRISYCTDAHTLEGSLDGFRKVAQKHNLG